MSNLSLHPELRGVRAVLFDVGGTLLHPDWPRLARAASDEAGRNFSVEEFRRGMGEVLRAVAEELQAGREPPAEERRPGWVFRRIYRSLGVDEPTCDRLGECLQATHLERHLWCDLDPEAPGVLAALKREGLRVAAISNTEDGRLEELLELSGLLPHLEFHLDSKVVGISKPDAAIFRMALERLGLAAHEAAFVGDSYAHDALAARAAGMRALLLDAHDLHPESVCPRIRSLRELIQIEESEEGREEGGKG